MAMGPTNSVYRRVKASLRVIGTAQPCLRARRHMNKALFRKL